MAGRLSLADPGSAASRALVVSYRWANVPFVPVVVLFFAWAYWVVAGRLES